MFIVTKKQIRPNTSVEFFSIRSFPQLQEVFKQYMFATYMSTGKLIDSTESISEDGLTKTVVTTWLDEAAHDEWSSDLFCTENFTNHYRQYCEANNITALTESKQNI